MPKPNNLFWIIVGMSLSNKLDDSLKKKLFKSRDVVFMTNIIVLDNDKEEKTSSLYDDDLTDLKINHDLDVSVRNFS